MPKGQLFIKGREGDFVDAYEVYGMSLAQTALSALMTPVPNKARIENSSRLENGKRITPTQQKKSDRSITLPFNITAKDEVQFMERYASLCELLAGDYIELYTSFQPIIYKLYYDGCTQFSQFRQMIGQFSIKFNEPDPTDRPFVK